MNRYRVHEAKPKKWLTPTVWYGRVFAKMIDHPSVSKYPDKLAVYFIEDEFYYYNSDFYTAEDPEYKHIDVNLLEKYYDKETPDWSKDE